MTKKTGSCLVHFGPLSLKHLSKNTVLSDRSQCVSNDRITVESNKHLSQVSAYWQKCSHCEDVSKVYNIITVVAFKANITCHLFVYSVTLPPAIVSCF